MKGYHINGTIIVFELEMDTDGWINDNCEYEREFSECPILDEALRVKHTAIFKITPSEGYYLNLAEQKQIEILFRDVASKSRDDENYTDFDIVFQVLEDELRKHKFNPTRINPQVYFTIL